MSAVPKDDTNREAGTAMTGPLKDQTVLVVGRGRAGYFAGRSARHPARRIGTSTSLTGQTLHIDGGEPLARQPQRHDRDDQ